MGDVALLMAHSVLRLGQRQARETEPQLRHVGNYPIPRPRYSPCPAPWETGAGQSARRNYGGSRHDDTSPHKWGYAARPLQLAAVKGAGGEGASEEGMPPSVLTPPEQRAKFSPFEHRREQREDDMRDGVGSAPAFSGQKPANTRHSWEDARGHRVSPRVTPRNHAPLANPKDGVLATFPSAAPGGRSGSRLAVRLKIRVISGLMTRADEAGHGAPDLLDLRDCLEIHGEGEVAEAITSLRYMSDARPSEVVRQYGDAVGGQHVEHPNAALRRLH